MAHTNWCRWLLSSGKQSGESQPEALTVSGIDADAGQGSATDLSDCTFHASTEDFLAAIDAYLS